MNTKIKLFNFLGSPVNLNLLFLIIFLFFPVSVSVSIFISVLIHEMAHAFVASKKGYQVYGIEIGLFSGSASMDANIHEKDSIPIIAAGPISNLILYLLSLIISFSIDSQFINDFMTINLFLFIFNILPIYPMDGGQITKDFLVRKMDRRKANRIAAKISLIFSILLITYSIMNGFLIMVIFGLMFVYYSLKNLKIIS